MRPRIPAGRSARPDPRTHVALVPSNIRVSLGIYIRNIYIYMYVVDAFIVTCEMHRICTPLVCTRASICARALLQRARMFDWAEEYNETGERMTTGRKLAERYNERYN